MDETGGADSTANAASVVVGTRLRCPACDLEVVITKAGAKPSLTCHEELEQVERGARRAR